MLLIGLAISAMALPSGAQELAGHWRFDQPNGEFANLAGSSEPAKVKPPENKEAIPLVADQIGDITEVAVFDGSGNAWISIPAKLADVDFTIEFWIKVDVNGREAMVLGNTSGVVIRVKPDGKLAFMLAPESRGAEWSYAEISKPVVLGQWLHGMARFSGGVQQLFVEDSGEILRSPEVKVDNPKQYVWPLTVLGINNFNQSAPFQGRMAALKIYSGALGEEDFKSSKP